MEQAALCGFQNIRPDRAAVCKPSKRARNDRASENLLRLVECRNENQARWENKSAKRRKAA
jgi:hypothetical protein